MRLPNEAHTSQPWRIHAIAPEFKLEDVWELPWRGRDAADFAEGVRAIAAMDPAQGSSRAARALWALRWKLGELLGWDQNGAGIGSRVPTLRDRLPADLRDSPGPEFDPLPFTSLYLTGDEFAAETANKTVHGVMHIGRVPDGAGAFRAHMAVLVKPNGLFGSAYMAAIRPFRHLIVYPPMLRDGERALREAQAARRAGR